MLYFRIPLTWLSFCLSLYFLSAPLANLFSVKAWISQTLTAARKKGICLFCLSFRLPQLVCSARSVKSILFLIHLELFSFFYHPVLKNVIFFINYLLDFVTCRVKVTWSVGRLSLLKVTHHGTFASPISKTCLNNCVVHRCTDCWFVFKNVTQFH